MKNINISGEGKFLVVYDEQDGYDCILTNDLKVYNKVESCLFKKKLPDNIKSETLEAYITKQLSNNSTIANQLKREFQYDRDIIILFNELNKQIEISYNSKFKDVKRLYNIIGNKNYKSDIVIESDL